MKISANHYASDQPYIATFSLYNIMLVGGNIGLVLSKWSAEIFLQPHIIVRYHLCSRSQLFIMALLYVSTKSAHRPHKNVITKRKQIISKVHSGCLLLFTNLLTKMVIGLAVYCVYCQKTNTRRNTMIVMQEMEGATNAVCEQAS